MRRTDLVEDRRFLVRQRSIAVLLPSGSGYFVLAPDAPWRDIGVPQRVAPGHDAFQASHAYAEPTLDTRHPRPLSAPCSKSDRP